VVPGYLMITQVTGIEMGTWGQSSSSNSVVVVVVGGRRRRGSSSSSSSSCCCCYCSYRIAMQHSPRGCKLLKLPLHLQYNLPPNLRQHQTHNTLTMTRTTTTTTTTTTVHLLRTINCVTEILPIILH